LRWEIHRQTSALLEAYRGGRDREDLETQSRRGAGGVNVSSKAVIMGGGRPEGIRVAVEHLHPEIVGVILSEQIIEHAVPVCSELRADKGVDFQYSLVERPFDIDDAFEKFEYLLSKLEAKGYDRNDILVDPTSGTTPSSKPHSLKRCPNYSTGKSLPTTSQLGKWGVTSTTSWN
jgi:hypothetical protein